MIGAAWKALPEAERTKYNDRSSKAKADFEAKHGKIPREKKEKKEKKEGKAKKVKDPNAPKREPTAYIKFSNAMRPTILAEHPELASKVTEVAKIVGEKWKALSDAEKAKYKTA